MNSLNPMRLTVAGALSLTAALCSCTTAEPEQRPDDPLKYSKKLVAEGHLSLYENGAFHVPNTSISLIPPGEKLWTSTNQSNAPMCALLSRLGFILSGQIDNLDDGDPELVFVRLPAW